MSPPCIMNGRSLTWRRAWPPTSRPTATAAEGWQSRAVPAKPRWLLAIPDAIHQLEALDRELLTRRDIEHLFGVSKVRAVQLMTAFGASRTGHLLTLPRTELLRQLIVDAGPAAVGKFLEFFAARIANRCTRAAYGRAVGQFLAWCEARGLALEAVSPLHVAAYIRTHPGSAPTVKQHLAAIRMLGDWLVVSQVLPVNPAAAVRGPKHVVTKGATPVLSPAEARRLLEAIDTGTLAGLRDRALVSVMLYSFARVSAVIGMRRQDYFRQESRGWLRLHEKGGKRHDVPAHHRAAEALDDYLAAAKLDEAKAALFQSVDPAGRRLTGRALSRRLVLAMIKRRSAAAGLPPSTCCHTFRATGITAYLSNGGTLEHAQQIAGHASPKTTKLYDRTADTITVDEIERIVI